MDARESVDYFIGGDRGGRGERRGVVLFATGKRESIFRGKKRETWFASLASRDAEPIVSVFCVRTEGGGMDAG